MKKRIPTKMLYSTLFPEFCLDEEQLSRLQRALLTMMVDFDAVCRKHGLTYYMSGGTLLGAVRHGGFIPWDDDIDVVMPKEDYERMPEIMATEYPDKYLVKRGYSTKTDPTANHKIYLRDSEYREISAAERDKPHMVFLDVFCLQSVSASPLSRKVRGAFADAAMLGAILSAEFRAPTKLLLERAKADRDLRAHLRPRRFLGFIANLMPMRFYYRLNRAMLKKDYKNSPLLHIPHAFRYNREVLPREVFGLPQEMAFAGHKFFAPADPHAYLTNLYGDYMQVPPPEKREKHMAVAVRFPAEE